MTELSTQELFTPVLEAECQLLQGGSNGTSGGGMFSFSYDYWVSKGGFSFSSMLSTPKFSLSKMFSFNFSKGSNGTTPAVLVAN